MRKSILLLASSAMVLGALSTVGCFGRGDKPDEYTKDNKLKVNVRNLYFDAYQGGDAYLDEIEREFGLKFELSSYSWAQWSQQVTGTINGDNVEDVFHANIDSYNFANTYKKWAMEEITKPLPEDLSQWPNIKKLIDHTSNIDSLKINGKLYGIPIAKDTTDYSTSFSPFTYVYRRDWAKEWNVYQPNDEYTWAQFEQLLDKFKTELAKSNRYALADVEWGYPSIPNFYKQVPHCFAQDATGKYVNNYTTNEYITGMNKARSFMSSGWYHPDQNTASDGTMNTAYYSNQVGVLFENLSYVNFVNLKTALRKTNASVENFNVDDALAIMKIKGENGKYALEGTDNWFSMTFFDYKITDNKQRKILDVLNWLLGEEGTRFSVFGIEDYDYVMEGNTVKIIEDAWPKDTDGEYAVKDNGGRYLRYLVSLGYDLLPIDPLTDQSAISYLNAWDAEMRQHLADGDLRVLKENAEVMWLTTDRKSRFSGLMRENALKYVMQYTYGDIATIDEYKSRFTSMWDQVLGEINNALLK